MASRLTGDWKRAGMLLKKLPVVVPVLARQKLYSDAEEVLDKLRSHIDEQDLPWVPLAQRTIQKKGHDIIYIETRYLRENLSIRRIPAGKNGAAVFIGASPWKTHKPTGVKLSKLMIWLEYGTKKMPARPLVRPTIEEMRDKLETSWQSWLKDIIGDML